MREPPGTIGSRPRELYRELVEKLPIAAVLIDLSGPRIIAASAAAHALIGNVTTIEEMLFDAKTSRMRLALVAEGVLKGYQAEVRLRGRQGEIPALADVQRVGIPGRDDFAFVVFTPEDPADAKGHLEQLATLGASFPRGYLEAPVIVGTVDSDWRITRLSSDVSKMCGFNPGDLVGTGFVGWLRPNEVGNVLIAFGRAFNEAASVTVSTHLRCRGGDWLPVSLLITPLFDHQTSEFAFVVRSRAGTEDAVGERVEQLEHRLWKIALEVQAAGFVDRLNHLPDLTRMPEIGDLSSRQLEVLTRLLDGQRVPAIAAAMFVSPNTVRNHLHAIYRQLGVHSQSELIELLKSHGDDR